MYTSRHLATLFGVTIETIRLWTIEFADYLSPTARPGTNKIRLYSQSDLEVMTLVAEFKVQNRTYTEIHATLKSGQRGEPKVQSPDDITDLASSTREQRLALEVERLQRQLVEVRHELELQRKVAEQVYATREENMHLKARADLIEQERQRLLQQLAELNARIEQLAEKAGHEYAKGFIDALREANVTPTRE
jgi:DNA-binding transcriptional MerR regulator